jgi:hypothetical protein
MSGMTADRKSADNSTYVVDKDIVDRGEATIVCQVVLDVLRHRLSVVLIDAYSDYRDEPPPQVAHLGQSTWSWSLTRTDRSPRCTIADTP